MEKENSFVPAEPARPEIKRLTPEEHDKAEGITPADRKATELGFQLQTSAEEELEALERKAREVLPEKMRVEKLQEYYQKLKDLDKDLVSQFNELTKEYPGLIPKEFLQGCNGLNKVKELFVRLIKERDRASQDRGPESSANKAEKQKFINLLIKTLEIKTSLLREGIGLAKSQLD